MVGGIGAYSGKMTEAKNYDAQRETYEIQRDAADRDAALTREAGAYEGARAVERGAQLLSRQVSGYASRGISPSTGTPLYVITSTGADVGLDIAAARFGTQRAIENSQTEAKIASRNATTAGMNASSSRAAAPLAFVAPVINAGATYLKGGFG